MLKLTELCDMLQHGITQVEKTPVAITHKDAAKISPNYTPLPKQASHLTPIAQTKCGEQTVIDK